MTPVKAILFVLAVCAAEKLKNDESKSLRTKTEKYSPDLQKDANIHSINNKSHFLSDISTLESLADNSTDIPTTVSYLNFTSTEGEFDNYYTTEHDNSTDSYETTEISLFSKPAVAVTTESPIKKNMTGLMKFKFCDCDLTYHACDINCCCDSDCSEEEAKLFSHCQQPQQEVDNRYCHVHEFYFKNNSHAKIYFDSSRLFCILKDNLPEKRAVDQYHDLLTANEVNKLTESLYKWPIENVASQEQKIHLKSYAYGDPIAMLDHSDASILDIPSPYLSDFCTNRKPVQFLKNSAHRCIAKLADLEMFNVYEYLNRSVFAAVPGKTKNVIDGLDVKNCSNVDCINWTVSVCDDKSCQPLNQSIHSASCDDYRCENIATKLKFIFHCSSERINRAEINLYLSKVGTFTYLEQLIEVKYFLEKDNKTEAVELSGNSGYIVGKPVVKLHTTSRNSNFSFNSSTPLKNIMAYPKNVEGNCVFSNTTYEEINFGVNFKSKCKFNFVWPTQEKNATEACNEIQTQLYEFLGFELSEKLIISPLGNPYIVASDDWLQVSVSKPDEKLLVGERKQDTKLECHNFVSTVRYEFIHANFSRPDDRTLTQLDRKILKSVVHFKDSDVIQFDSQVSSLVLGTSGQFFDVSEPVIFEYARGPQLFIHFPSDFFYPFTSNASQKYLSWYIFLVCLYNVIRF